MINAKLICASIIFPLIANLGFGLLVPTSIGRSGLFTKTYNEDFSRRLPQRINYRRDDDNNASRNKYHSQAATSQRRLLFKIVTNNKQQSAATSSSKPKQKAVDEYLEFLDKRYHRLHPKRKTKTKKKIKDSCGGDSHGSSGFNALKWLTQGDANDECVITHQQQEDALYVLGVAGLASKELLQKHNLQNIKGTCSSTSSVRKKESIDTGVIIDAQAIVTPIQSEMEEENRGLLVEGSAATKVVNHFWKTATMTLQRVQARRQALIAYQMKKVNDFLRLSIQSLSSAPRTIRDVWVLGGGKKTFAITLSIATTILLFVRPILQNAFNSAGSYNISS